MEGTYEVLRGGQAIGSVEVTRQGLYYHICCRCRLSGEVMFRLWMCFEEDRQDLGILTPMDGCFGLKTRLPVKKAGQGSPKFQLRPNRQALSEPLSGLDPKLAVPFLTRLEKSYLARENGQICIAFKEEK